MDSFAKRRHRSARANPRRVEGPRACIEHLLTCALMLLLAACVVNPATGKRQLNFVSKKDEIAIGQQGAQEVQQSIGVYDAAALNAYVNRVGQKLAAVSERKDLPWSFQVVDDPGVNAFALPGGPIFITRGLLAHMENEAQLASVLGHEIGHVTAQHSVNQMSKSQLANMGLGLGAALSSSVAQLGGLGAQGLQLLFLKFGRDDERQSDDLGIRYMVRAGYDPREMPKVFETLGRVSEAAGGSKVPGWLQSHPQPEERVRRGEKKIASMQGQNFDAMEKGQDPYMKAIDGMVYGPNPREGFFRDGRFYHPGLAFSVDMPSGFKAENTKQAVIAASPEGDAAFELRMGPAMPAEQAVESFLKESGVTRRDGPKRVGKGSAASFEATTEAGQIGGIAFFVEQQGHTFMMLGLSDASRFAQYQDTFLHSFASFAPVTDESILEVGPNRLQVEKLASATSIRDLAQEHRGMKPEELALLNQAEVGASLPAGEYAKWVSPSER
ncbi:MAG: M48 family metalloprotease [Myxococcales bacterium]